VRKLLNRLLSLARMRAQALTRASGTASANDAADRLIARGNEAEKDGKLSEACELYRKAVQAAPGYAKAHLNLGIGLEAAGDVEGAIGRYEAALGIDAADAYANYNLANLLYARGDLARAEPLLKAALESKPDFPEAQVVLSNVHDARGDLSAAIGALEAALKKRPDYAGAWNNYGVVLSKLGRLAEAETALRRVTEIDPGFVPAHFLLGNILVERGQLADALAPYRRAIELRPDFPEAHANLGCALKELGRLDEAGASCREALRLKPDYAEAHYYLGVVYRDQARRREALACFDRALELKPGFAQAHYGRGHVLCDEDRCDEAVGCFEKAVSLNPEYALARWSLAMARVPAVFPLDADPMRYRAAFSSDLGILDRWFDATRAAEGYKIVGNQTPFFLAYQEENNRDLLERYGRLCTRLMADWFDRQAIPHAENRGSAGPIRVGVVSQFFRNHSVWNAIVKGWFQRLDPKRFELLAFSLGIDEDHETQFAKSRASHFEQGVRGLRQWVDAITRQRPDVLIYPEIGMDASTVKLASLRLAPVQVATWGHPETTGLPTMDYYLSAEDLEPADAQENYTERLVALPHLGCCSQPSRIVAAKPDLAGLGIDAESPLLLCPGAPFKYAPQHDRVLVEIARRLGGCRFIFFMHFNPSLSDKLRRRLEAVFARNGLDFDDFVAFVPWQRGPQFCGWLRRADVFLDSIGFSGYNTAMLAVECGLPIVTREGRFMRGRLASGILKRMGLSDLVAQTEEDYVALAVKLVQDTGYRKRVGERIEASRAALFDDVAVIRALEDFLVSVANRG
jgi:predicted O-linked N-acetylglucosamine transferase (SPINDLY family)